MPTIVEAFLTAQKVYGWAQKVSKWWAPFAQQHKEQLNELADTFGPPKALAERYILPDSQQLNPADSETSRFDRRRPVFDGLVSSSRSPPSYTAETTSSLSLRVPGWGRHRCW